MKSNYRAIAVTRRVEFGYIDYRVPEMTNVLRLLTATILVACLATTSRADEDARQYYTAFVPQENQSDQYLAKYFFKTDPSSEKYRFQYVVWVKHRPDTLYFFNEDHEYWCAASTRNEHKDRWNIFPDNEIEKELRIDLLPKFTEFPQRAPLIPGTKGMKGWEEPMLFPNFAGLPPAAFEFVKNENN